MTPQAQQSGLRPLTTTQIKRPPEINVYGISTNVFHLSISRTSPSLVALPALLLMGKTSETSPNVPKEKP